MVNPSGTLVGRDAELAELVALLGVDGSDRPRRPVLLAGDAGVGKTRILTELTARAAEAGHRVLVGHCVDFGDSALAYLPISEVVDGLAAALPEVVASVERDHPALSRLRAGGRTLDAARDTEAGREAATGRGELFAAVHALLEAAAEQVPLLIVFEDLHWADQSSRELLTYLFTRSFVGQVRLVASYRSDDLHRRHPLRRQVAEWSRLVHRVSLEPLPDDAVRTLVAELVPTGLRASQLTTIVTRAEGNAFFVEELVAAADTIDRGLPADLAEVLLVRLDRLDAAARAVVQAASASGRFVRHDMLEVVAGIAEADLDGGVRQAVETHVLVTDGDRYAFRHALLGEAVYDDLLPGERVRLHQRYVAALRDGSARGTAAELARHARLAGDRDTALDASIRAGDEALRVGGPGEAAHHFEQALALLAETRAPADDALVDLVVRTCDAMNAAGSADRGGELAREHLDRLPPDAPGLWRARLLTASAEMSLAYVDGADIMTPTTEAVAALPADAPSAVRAKVLGIHARAFSLDGRLADANRVGREALAAAEDAGHERLAAEFAITVAFTDSPGSTEAWRAGLRDATARAEKAGAQLPDLRGRMLLGRALLFDAEHDEAADVFSGGLARAVEQGVPWAPYAFDCRAYLAWIRIVQGRWDEALVLTAEVGGPPVLQAWLDALRLTVEQARGSDVGDAVARTRALWPQEMELVILAGPLAMIAAGRRQGLPDVVAAYDAACEAGTTIDGEDFEPRVRLAAVGIGAIAAVLPRLPAAERAAAVEQARRMRADAQRVTPANIFGDPWGVEGQAWLRRVDAEELRTRWLAGVDAPDQAELVTVWQDAERAFAELGDVHELARVRTALAGILRAGGDAAGARALADAAREVAHALGAQPLLDELRTLGSTPVRNDATSTDLTAREREILTLVAGGRTNGEIGKQLFISAKTVSVHVSNILAKLGAAGRTEAAAIARRRGLIEEG
ncbi:MULTISPECIES: helix-turn-helix transcriptional regulator [unclassified Nocardioides]|uniref:helix-turn-helix transcriptional regulator n=1 Tax=unclassified Nocardioides TaxID=2615069 RepID=UPI00361F76F8